MVFFIFIQILIEHSVSEYADKMTHYAVSDLGLQCLPMSHKEDARLICAKKGKKRTKVIYIIEPQHEISNNKVCATSKGSDQPAHMRSLIRAFASRFNIL